MLLLNQAPLATYPCHDGRIKHFDDKDGNMLSRWQREELEQGCTCSCVEWGSQGVQLDCGNMWCVDCAFFTRTMLADGGNNNIMGNLCVPI